MHLSTKAAAIAVAALLTAPAFAGVTFATGDLASFQAGLASSTLEDFQATSMGPLDQFSATQFNGFSTTVGGESEYAEDYAVSEWGEPGNAELRIFLDNTGGYIPSITFTFDSAVNAFGMWIDSIDVTGEYITLDVNGQSFLLTSLLEPDSDGEAYFVVTSDEAITSFTLSAADSEFDSLGIDNVVAGTIPAPATIGLLGLAGLLPAHRRRR